MKYKHFIIPLLFIFFLMSGQDILAQCPMCKASLESAKTNGTQVGNTLNSGILYLLALPYSVTAVFGVIMYRRHREKKRQQNSIQDIIH